MIPMFLGASIEPKLIFVAVAVVIGIVNAWLEKKKKDREAANNPAPTAPRRQESASRSGSDEQERLRHFLESLGVSQPSRPQQQPQFSQNRPRPTDPRMQVRKPAAKTRGKPVPKPPLARQPAEIPRAGRIEEAASSIEAISGEFGAMNVRVAMDPVKTLEMPGHLASGAAGTTSVTEREISPHIATVRRLLQKPGDLRAAFVVMEILGPPHALRE